MQDRTNGQSTQTHGNWTEDRAVRGVLTFLINDELVSGEVEMVRYLDGAWTVTIGDDREGSCDALVWLPVGRYSEDPALQMIISAMQAAQARRNAR